MPAKGSKGNWTPRVPTVRFRVLPLALITALAVAGLVIFVQGRSPTGGSAQQPPPPPPAAVEEPVPAVPDMGPPDMAMNKPDMAPPPDMKKPGRKRKTSKARPSRKRGKTPAKARASELLFDEKL